MSHKATNWAISQRGLEPATKILLWYLADCHNAHTGLCNPSQDRLAEDCEMSRATVNRHLEKLEYRGMIRRVRRVNPETKRQESTVYELAIDALFNTDQSEAVSQNDTREIAEPCLKLEQSRVSNLAVSVSHSCETLTCKGTGNITKNVRESGLFSEQDIPQATSVDQHFAAFWKAYPKAVGKPAAQKNFLKAVKDGEDPARIVEGARRYAAWLANPKPGEFRPIPKHPQGWLTDQRWNDPDLWVQDQNPARSRYAAIREEAERAAQR